MKGEKYVQVAFEMFPDSPSTRYFRKADCWFKLCEILEKRSKLLEVETITRQALSKITHNPTVDKVPFFRRKLAFALRKLSRGKKSVDVLLEHYAMCDEIHSTDVRNAQDTAFGVLQLVYACNEEGRIRPEAEMALQRRYDVLFEQKDKFGYSLTLDVARLYINVGNAQTEKLFLHCPLRAQQSYGTSSKLCQQPEMELGELLHLKGRCTGARDQTAQCLEQDLNRHNLTPTDATVLRVRNNLAMCNAMIGQTAEARAILSDVVKVGEKAYGESVPTVFVWQCNLGFVLRLCGELQQSREILFENLSRREEAHGKTSPALHIARRHLAETCIDLGQYEEAAALLAYVPRVEDVTKPLLGQLVISLACDYLRGKLQLLTKGDQAHEILLKTVENHINVLGEKHPHVQTARLELANAYLQAGKERKEAQKLLLEVKKILEEASTSGMSNHQASTANAENPKFKLAMQPLHETCIFFPVASTCDPQSIDTFNSGAIHCEKASLRL